MANDKKMYLIRKTVRGKNTEPREVILTTVISAASELEAFKILEDHLNQMYSPTKVREKRHQELPESDLAAHFLVYRNSHEFRFWLVEPKNILVKIQPDAE